MLACSIGLGFIIWNQLEGTTPNQLLVAELIRQHFGCVEATDPCRPTHRPPPPKTILALIGLCVGVNLGNLFTILSRLAELIKQQYRPPPPRQCTQKPPSPKTKVENTNHRKFWSTCLCTNFGLGEGGRCVGLHGSVASTHPKCCLISSATSN